MIAKFPDMPKHASLTLPRFFEAYNKTKTGVM